ncbi:MAG: phosphatase PAP2 family protein [Thermodesulfovibrionales bacterium]
MKRIFSALFQQRPADTVTIIFLLFLTGLTLFYFAILPRAPYLLGIYSLMILTQIILIRFRDNGRFMRNFYDVIFPIICVLAVFDSLEWIVHYINPEDIDPVLIRLDYLIFGNHPTVMLESIMNPFLTDILQIAYSTYYFIPISFSIILLMNKQREEFDKTIFMILLCFYLSYLGYILFPALGPRFCLSNIQTTELQGFFAAEPIQNLLNRLEGIKRDAFPSGHTGIALTVLYLAWRFRKGFFRIALPIVSAMIFSTVYCRYHYVVDVIAGFGLTLLTVVLGEWYYGWWIKRQVKGRTDYRT